MIAQNAVPSLVKDRRAQFLRPLTLPSHLGISSVPIDIRDEPLGNKVGAKGPAKIQARAGGCGFHGCCVAVANNIDAGVAGAQACGDWASMYRHIAATAGVKAFIVERASVPAAISVARANGHVGEYELDVQRQSPLTVSELTRLTAPAIKLPQSIIVGPTPLDEESHLFHETVSRLAPRRALMVHPSMLHHPARFSQIGRYYQFVFMNKAEACIADDSTQEIEKLACRVRFLLGGGVPFAISNGAEAGGLVFDDNGWHPIKPCSVTDQVCDVGAGDVFSAAYVLSRWYRHAEPKAAVAYACIAAAAWICDRPIPPFRP